MTKPEYQIDWKIKTVAFLGQRSFFFESWSIAFLTLAINILTSLAFLRATDSQLPCNKVVLCFLIILLAIYSFWESLTVWSRIKPTIQEKLDEEDTRMKLKNDARLRRQFVRWLLSSSIVVGLIIVLLLI